MRLKFTRMGKYALGIVLLQCFSAVAFAQQSTDPAILNMETNKRDNTPLSITFSPSANLKATDAQDIFKKYLQLGDNNTKMVLRNSTTTNKTVVVDRYDQYYKNIKIEMGNYTITSKDGLVTFMMGTCYKVSAAMPTTPAITEAAALSKAMQYIGATKYKWQDANAEAFIKRQKKDEYATYFPKAELVYIEDCATELHDGKLHLAYGFNIYAEQPMSRYMVYVDAATGKLLLKNSLIHNTVATTTAPTLYSGTIPFTTDLSGGVYSMHNLSLGAAIVTQNMNNTDYNTTEYTNNNNVWAQDAANDVHWAAQKVYSYWSTQRGRLSYDNANGEIDNYVHYREAPYNSGYDNAFWDGSEMIYGDGTGWPGFGFNALVALDVCAHELGHGVCQYTAGLLYQGESGAMNEGFSDCWGATIENYGDPHESDAVPKSNWLIGEELRNTANPLRSMAAPKTQGQPDTYLGTNWYPVTGCSPGNGNDECGVHTNSGVLNKFYYLVCNGGSGTNDLAHAYNVTGIGFSEGANILYQTELSLSNSANYAACRTASINVTTTLYGACSPELITVTKAWYAVGVGADYTAPAVLATGAISNPATPCIGASVTYSVAPVAGATGYVWTVTGTGWSGTSATNSITFTAGSGVATITCAAQNTCGVTGTPATKTVTPNGAAPAASITFPGTICPGNVATFSTPTIAGAASYVWTVSGTGWSGTSSTSSINVTIGSGTGTISVRGNSATCGLGAAYTTTVTSTGLTATPVINPPAAACQGSTVVYTVTPLVNADSYVWTVSGTGWSGSSATNTISVTVGSGTGTLTVHGVSNTCGAGPTTTYTTTPTVSVPAAVTINAPALICNGNVATFSTPVIPGASAYVWTVAGTGWSGTSTTNVITTSVGSGIGTLSVAGTNACATGAAFTLNNIDPQFIPDAPVLGNTPVPCQGVATTYSVTPVNGATDYVWTITGTGWAGGVGTSDTSNVTAGTDIGTVTVQSENACGMSTPVTIQVTPNAMPDAAASIDTSLLICSSDTTTLSTPAIANATSYNWTVTGTGWSGTSATNTILVNTGAGTGTITVSGVNACGTGTAFTLTGLTTAVSPVATYTANHDTVIVTASAILTFTGTAAVGATYTWNFGGGTATPGTGAGPQTVAWATGGMKYVTLTISQGGCTNTFLDSVLVTVPSSVQALALQNDITVVPNPNDGKFDLLFGTALNKAFTVRLTDATGRVVYTKRFPATTNNRVSVSTDNLPNAVYTATIEVSGLLVNKKVTIIK